MPLGVLPSFFAMPSLSSKTSDWLAAIACVSAGVLISALPHLSALARTGRPDWVSTDDERFYLAVGSQAYFNHPGKLADPVRAEDWPSIFRPLPFLPGVWAAKVLSLDPLGIGLMWRVLAGATVGLGWFVLFRQKIPRPWVAASLALILLSDPGLTQGFPLIRLARRAIMIASAPSDSLFGWGYLFFGWRVVNPATTMPYLIALIWAVFRAREAPTRGRIALAGLTFGLLFHVYFYYWTAAGVALLLALALDAGHRRIYFHTGWIGGLLGLPVVVSDFLLKQSQPSVTESLLRQDRFLPIDRFGELTLPPEILVVIALGLAWVVVRRRDLIFIWSLGTAALLLANHQVLTGLQIENYHWMYVWGPAFEFFLVLSGMQVIGDRMSWSPRTCAALGAIALAVFGVGLWIRGVEATRCEEAVANARAISAYRAEFRADSALRFAPNSVVAGDADFVDFAGILDNLRPLYDWSVYLSASVTDAELDDRAALSDLLSGVDRPAFEARQRAFYENKKLDMGAWKRDRSLIPILVAARLSAYDRTRADLTAALDRFGVRYVGLRAGAKPGYLDRGWIPVATGPTWNVWERTSIPIP